MLAMVSCKTNDVIVPSGDKNTINSITNVGFFKKWKLASYETRKALNFNVIMELKPEKNEKGFYILNGKSTINFYYAGFEYNTDNKTFSIKDISVTEIAGAKADQEIETDFLTRLAKIGKYEISEDNKTLTLISTGNSPQKMYFVISE